MSGFNIEIPAANPIPGVIPNPLQIIVPEIIQQQLVQDNADAIEQVKEKKRFSRDTCIAAGPEYIPVTIECQNSIDFTSTITSDYITDEGGLFVSHSSVYVPADEIDTDSFIMWTDERVITPKIANADFASGCNWTFGHVKGMTVTKTMVIVIGQLFIDDEKPETKTGYYMFNTPKNFLAPAGLNRDSAKSLLADFNAYDSNIYKRSLANKRQRTQLPTTLRASNTNQGESSIYLQDIDGNFHLTREKKEIGKREKELGPIWRLTKGREKHIMGKDCILQVTEYKQHIMDESINQSKDSSSVYSDSSLVRLIKAHPIVKEDKYLKMFLRANFGSDSATSLQFSSFLPHQFLPGSLPTYSARCDYAKAADSFEVAARVFYSKEFITVMDPIRLILCGPLDTLSLVSDDLLLWTIERSFNKWGKTIRMDSSSTDFPGIALDTPTGCACLLTTMLTTDLMSLSGESLFLQERFYKATVAAEALHPSNPENKIAKTERNKIEPQSTNCRFHMAYLLDAKLMDGKKISPCKRGKDCRSNHLPLNAITKSAALSLASKFNMTLRDSVIARIENMSDKFKK